MFQILRYRLQLQLSFCLIIFVSFFGAALTPSPTLAQNQTNCPALNGGISMKSLLDTRTESGRLAALALEGLEKPQPDYEQIGLLALRSLDITYSLQADAALQSALVCLSPSGFLVAPAANTKFTALTLGYRVVNTFLYRRDQPLLATNVGKLVKVHYKASEEKPFNERLYGHSGAVFSVGTDKYGIRLITGGADKIARVWINQSQQPVLLRGHTEPVTGAALTANGLFAITGSADKTIRFWNATSGQEIRQFIGHTATITSVTFIPAGDIIVSADENGTLRTWETLTGRALRNWPAHMGRITNVITSPDGHFAFTAGADQLIRQWDIATGKEIRQFIGHTGAVTSLAIHLDGKTLISGGEDATIRAWDVEKGKEITVAGISQQGPSPVVGIALTTPDNQLVALYADGTLVQGGEQHNVYEQDEQFYSRLGYSEDLENIYSARENVLRLWDSKTGKLRDPLFAPNIIKSVSSDLRRAIISGNRAGELVVDLTTQSTFPKVTSREFLWELNISADGKTIIGIDGTNPQNHIVVWDAVTGVELRRFPIKVAWFDWSMFTLSKDGKLIIGATLFPQNDEQPVRVWEVDSGREIASYGNSGEKAWSASISSDNDLLIIKFGGGEFELWDLKKNTLRFTGEATHLAFSADGQSIFSTFHWSEGELTTQMPVSLWNTETGQDIRQFMWYGKRIVEIKPSPDGKHILFGSDGGIVQHLVDLSDAMAEACRLIGRDFTAEERARFGITDSAPTCRS